MTAWRFLFFSIALHLILWLFLLSRPPFDFHDQSKNVEISIIENPKSQPRSIVRQALPPLDMLKPEPPKNPKYLSEKDQNVKKEMKAQLKGLTQNGNSTFNNPHKTNVAQNSSGNAPPDQGDQGIRKNLERYAPGPISPNPNGPSNNIMTANGEYLPDVASGPITALNSERFVFYSFFSRIEERLRPLWERNVEYTVQRLPASAQKQLVNHNWVTALEILVDPQGHYLETIVQQSSGVTEIDNAAINAFAEAKFFPNPPKEMIKSDGKIHLNYVFVVEWGPNGWNRPSL